MPSKDPIKEKTYQHLYYAEHRDNYLLWKHEHRDRCSLYTSNYRKRQKEQDKEAWLAKQRKYDKKRRLLHPKAHFFYSKTRRARLKNVVVNFSKDQWEAIKRAYKYRCAYCGKKTIQLTQDHVIPLAKGGSHTPENIVPACISCNSSKGTKVPSIIPNKRLLL